MNISALPKTNVPAPGTPVALPAATCAMIDINPAKGNTGTVYVVVGGYKVRAMPTPSASGQGDGYRIVAVGGDSLHLEEFSIDADTAGDGVYVSYVVE